MSGSSRTLLIIMACMVLIMALSWGMEFFASKLLPLLFSGAGFLLAGIALWRELRQSRETPAAATEDKAEAPDEMAGESWGGYWRQMLWMVGFVAGIFFLGVMVAVPLFLVSYMKWLGTRWRTAIISAVASTAVIYGVFFWALQMSLHKGLLFG